MDVMFYAKLSYDGIGLDICKVMIILRKENLRYVIPFLNSHSSFNDRLSETPFGHPFDKYSLQK